MKEKPTQSRGGVKGGFPLAGSRDSVPCGVWGNAPTVSRPTNPKGQVNKAQAAKRPCPKLRTSADAPPTRSIRYSHIVAPNGRDRIATGSAALNAADPVFRFNHPMPASTASSHSAASSSSQSSSQPSSSQSSSSSASPIALNADAGAVPTNISSLSANIIR